MYHTDFRGFLEFSKGITPEEIEKLKTFMGEDIREHPEWGAKELYPDEWLSYIDLDMVYDSDDMHPLGLECTAYNGETSEMVEQVNIVLHNMRKDFPDFTLYGFLEAQGDSWDDHWFLMIEDGKAVKKDSIVSMEGTEIECPHCHKKFNLKNDS